MKVKSDNQKYQAQLKYFNDYYGSEFKKGQGTEEILEMIHTYSKRGTLVDFGSGSNIYFWLLAFKDISSVTCVDISLEALLISDEIRKGNLILKSSEFPAKKYKSSIENVVKIPVEKKVLDIFNDDLELFDKFDNVSQFGLLGLCKNEDEYIKNLNKILSFLNDDGIFLGANWIFSDVYVTRKGFSNDYLTEELIIKNAKKSGYEILFVEKFPIKNDINYDYVLVYALKRRNDYKLRYDSQNENSK